MIDWGGYEYALAPDHVKWVANSDTAWLTAGAMENYSVEGDHVGVIGQIRFSWDIASMGASTVEEFRDAVLAVQTLARGEVRYRASSTDEWQHETLQVNVVPEPATMALLALGGLLLRRKK